VRALFVLTPPESKRFIAKAVARLPAVLRAKVDGEIVIGHGSTNVRVAEEIMGDCPERDRFISGQVINGILCVTGAEAKPPMIVMHKGTSMQSRFLSKVPMRLIRKGMQGFTLPTIVAVRLVTLTEYLVQEGVISLFLWDWKSWSLPLKRRLNTSVKIRSITVLESK
jgi:hypothetical protein